MKMLRALVKTIRMKRLRVLVKTIRIRRQQRKWHTLIDYLENVMLITEFTKDPHLLEEILRALPEVKSIQIEGDTPYYVQVTMGDRSHISATGRTKRKCFRLVIGAVCNHIKEKRRNNA